MLPQGMPQPTSPSPNGQRVLQLTMTWSTRGSSTGQATTLVHSRSYLGASPPRYCYRAVTASPFLTKSNPRTYQFSVIPMKSDVPDILKRHGILPTAQRLAVAEYVLSMTEHPSADNVWAGVRESFTTISRATVYNTLNLFVEKGLLRALPLA